MNTITHPTPEIAPLTEVYDERLFATLEELPDVTLVERRDFEQDKRLQQECIWYVCKKLDTVMYDLFGFFPWRPEGYVLSSKLRPDCPIVYHRSPRGGAENHIGLYLGKGRVESKFGYGHVYRHPIDCVPKNCGPYYFACVPALTEDKETTLDNMELWYDLYKDILSIEIEFDGAVFPQSARCVVDSAIQDLGLLKRAIGSAGGGQDEANKIYYIKYQVVDNFLDKKEHRDQLRAIYESAKSQSRASSSS